MVISCPHMAMEMPGVKRSRPRAGSWVHRPKGRGGEGRGDEKVTGNAEGVQGRVWRGGPINAGKCCRENLR